MALRIDGDGHVMETPEELVEFLPDGFRSWVPRLTIDKFFPPLDHFHQMPTDKRGSGRGHVGVSEWRKFLDDVGLAAAVLYPTKGLSCGRIRDRHWSRAISQAYNNWLYETYCQKDERFRGMGILPMLDPDAAAAELRRIVNDLGFPGAILPSNGTPNHLGSPFYEPLYEAADSVGARLAVHGGVHEGMGFDDFHVYAGVHALGHPFGQLISFAGIILGGVLDRHPNVTFAFLEGGVSWLFLALERLDESYETHIPWDHSDIIQLREGEDPAKYILRHFHEDRIYMGCEGEEPFLAEVIDLIGETSLLYASDFPHEVTTDSCIEAIKDIESNEKISPSARENILGVNAKSFYAMTSVQA